MRLFYLLIPILFSSISFAETETSQTETDKFKIALGGYLVAHHSSEMYTRSPFLIGTNINLQDDLGMDSQTRSVHLQGHYRFTPKHKLEFSYYALNTTSTKKTEQDINFFDYTFSAGATIDSFLKMDIFKLNYAYSFYHNDDVELSAGIGAHMLRTNMGLSGSAVVNGVPVGDSSESAKFLAPLPVLGYRMDYKLSENLKVIGSLDYFGLNIDNFSGYFTDIRAAAEYTFYENFGIGAGLNFTVLDLEVKKTKKYKVEQGVSGILLYASYTY